MQERYLPSGSQNKPKTMFLGRNFSNSFMNCHHEKWKIVCRACNEEIPKEFLEGEDEELAANIAKSIADLLRRKSN